jgi:hypothetical protein
VRSASFFGKEEKRDGRRRRLEKCFYAYISFEIEINGGCQKR